MSPDGTRRAPLGAPFLLRVTPRRALPPKAVAASLSIARSALRVRAPRCRPHHSSLSAVPCLCVVLGWGGGWDERCCPRQDRERVDGRSRPYIRTCVLSHRSAESIGLEAAPINEFNTITITRSSASGLVVPAGQATHCDGRRADAQPMADQWRLAGRLRRTAILRGKAPMGWAGRLRPAHIQWAICPHPCSGAAHTTCNRVVT